MSLGKSLCYRYPQHPSEDSLVVRVTPQSLSPRGPVIAASCRSSVPSQCCRPVLPVVGRDHDRDDAFISELLLTLSKEAQYIIPRHGVGGVLLAQPDPRLYAPGIYRYGGLVVTRTHHTQRLYIPVFLLVTFWS